ncbi:MAG: GMC family oxidoreductase [Pseudolabrys sp.]
MVKAVPAAEADVIVVGAGSAGSAAAARLADAGRSVLLVEAGRGRWRVVTRMPGAVIGLVGRPGFDWCHFSEEDRTRHGRRELWSRGKLPGGSSAINGMVFVRGAASDFDAWERLGARGWSAADVLPIFRRLERTDFDDATRGRDGPIPVSRLSCMHPLTACFVEACRSLGIPLNADLNGIRQEGVGYVQANIARGRRVDAFDAYVRPRIGSKLRFLAGHRANRIVFDGNRAVGIEMDRDGVTSFLSARGGVVLCAGAIGSPHLLMLSGIGPAHDLRACGIVPRMDMPEVGRNLMEHPAVFVDVEVDCATGNSDAQLPKALLHGARWLLRGDGPAANPAAQALAFFRSSARADEPDLQFQLFAFARTTARWLEDRRLMSLSVSLSHPESRGFLRLRSADPGNLLEIHPHLLAARPDVHLLARGFDWARRVICAAPFAAHVVKDLTPHAGSTEELEIYIRKAAEPLYHVAGTCRMGSDAASVLDPSLRVRNTDGVWVADTSIFPRHISGNTHATALMIGERAGELIAAATRP